MHFSGDKDRPMMIAAGSTCASVKTSWYVALTGGLAGTGIGSYSGIGKIGLMREC